MTEPAPQIEVVIIPEIVVPGKRLGRHVRHDPRSKQHPAEGAPVIQDVLHAGHGLPFNQGQIGDCTTNALCGCLNSDPNYSPPAGAASRSYPATEADCITLYSRETTNEGQPYPPNDPGGSGLAACQAARQLGWIDRYAHTFSLDAALRALVLRPIMQGSLWYDSMDQPDSNGLVTISPNAVVRGGHEYEGFQIVTAEQLVVYWNSWGNDWGIGGRFAMSFATIEQLLAQQGDVTVPGAAVAR